MGARARVNRPGKSPSREQIEALLIDLDGTLFRGRDPIPGGLAFMEWVRERRIPHLFVTNNSTRTAASVADFLCELGYTATPHDVYTSAQAAAELLVRSDAGGGPVYVIGEEGLLDALSSAGVSWTKEATDQTGASADRVEALPVGTRAVLVGLDRAVDYSRLAVAMRLIRAGAPFIGTNPDAVFPVEEGLVPGAGSILAFLSAATGVKPQIAGKPSGSIVRAACLKLGVSPSRVAVIGDNPHTDVVAGRAAGAYTVLVRTGVFDAVASAKEDIPTADTSVGSLIELCAAWDYIR